MQPFLLAFVDSEFFQLFGRAIELLFLLAVGVAACLVVVLARYGLQHWQRPQPGGSARWGSRLLSGVALLPAVLVGLAVAIFGSMELLESRRDQRRHTAYKTALTRKVKQLQIQAAGKYTLVESSLPGQNQPLSTWQRHDSATVAYISQNHGRPRVELLLRSNGTFVYQSSIIGDATGRQVAGSWKLEPYYYDQEVRNMDRFKIYFHSSAADSVRYKHLRGLLESSSYSTQVDLTGTFLAGSNSLLFKLRKEAANN